MDDSSSTSSVLLTRSSLCCNLLAALLLLYISVSFSHQPSAISSPLAACNVISQSPEGSYTMVIPQQHRNCSFSIIYPVEIDISEFSLEQFNHLSKVRADVQRGCQRKNNFSFSPNLFKFAASQNLGCSNLTNITVSKVFGNMSL